MTTTITFTRNNFPEHGSVAIPREMLEEGEEGEK